MESASDFKSKKKNIFGFGLHRNSYVIPLNIQVYIHSPIGNEHQFMACFKAADCGKEYSYVITDTDYIIKHVSSKANFYLGLSTKLIRSKQIDIRSLCKKINEYTSNGVQNIFKNEEYIPLPLTSDELKLFKISCPLERLQAPIYATITAGTIDFSKCSVVGYFFRFQHKRIKQKQEIESSPKNIQPLSLMHFDPVNFRYHREMEDINRKSRFSFLGSSRIPGFSESDPDNILGKVYIGMHTFVGQVASKIDQIGRDLPPESIEDFQEQMTSKVIL